LEEKETRRKRWLECKKAFLPISRLQQGCQMVCFQTKNPNLGKFWTALELKMMVYFMPIWKILRPFGILNGHLVILWYFGIFFPVLSQENLATLGYNSSK
jgi:hypothetical protein